MSLSGFNHTLHWSEFSVVDQRPQGAVKDAEVAISIGNISWRTAKQTNGDCAVVGVNAAITVDQNSSWVVNGKKGIYLRHHEQGRYDIKAIGVRQICDSIESLVKSRCEEIHHEAHKIQNSVLQLINETLARYEKQTNYGNNLPVQKAWEAQIKVVKLRHNGVLTDLPK